MQVQLQTSLCGGLGRFRRRWRRLALSRWWSLMQPKNRGGVGFWDFHLFNQALLARQAWRLISRPDNLCAQVLQARYYPAGKLEDTVFMGNASSSWQAISHGLELLKKGSIWQVSNGRSIRVCHNWIPWPFSYKPISRQGLCRIRFVSGLLA